MTTTTPESLVCIRRGWFDYRSVDVPFSALTGWHMTTDAGGTHARLPRATLAAYVLCTDLPAGEEFGHSCIHGRPPHSIKVLVFKNANLEIYKDLRALVPIRRGA
jgi:hypothetical protein